MQQQSVKPDVPCPVCGAEPHYRAWGQTTWYVYVEVHPKKQKIGSAAQPLVCKACGYIQFFANPEDFRD